ncbi:MAG: flagellar M-ring protein FliF [Rickettsiaceae bacterium H1]|nr:flagellar M-ring protein FliF [Rickettsiaceae bacterium H1]
MKIVITKLIVVLNLIKKLKKQGKVAVISAVFGGIIFFVFIFVIFVLHHEEMNLLYKDISITDRSLIINKLNSLGIDYEIHDGEIFIGTDLIRKTRMLLAAEGLPSNVSVVGYEVFNKSESLGTSNFAQNVSLLRALEGELSRTIMSFNSIQHARVHLVIPKRELFSKKANKPKASIVLKLRVGATLDSKQISAITHLVSSAVQDLTPEEITIVGTEGKPFKLPDSTGEFAAGSSLQEYKSATERQLKHSIESLIGKFVGEDRVKAEVNVELDLEHLTVDSEIFNPEGQVVRSVQNTEENSNNSENADSVSVANNIPNYSSGNGLSGNSSNAEKKEEIINYEISREVAKKTKELGSIKRLSIAVLVDGYYSYDDNIGKYSYTPHDSDVIAKLYSLAASASGFNPERGDVLEVVNMQFLPRDQSELAVFSDEEVNTPVYEKVKFIVFFLVSGLILLMFLFKSLFFRRKLAKEERTENEIEIPTEKVSIFIKINELIGNNPNDAISMVRNWMKEENGR